MATKIEWIKITAGMFEDEKIEFIDTLPEGDAIINIWVRLLCMAGKCNAGGYIFITEKIPYTEDALASKFRKKPVVVKMALETLVGLGMINREDDGMLAISNWAKHQNVDGMEKIREQTRKRVAEYRDRRKSLTDETVCQYCGSTATGYDHILAVARGGEDVDDNKVHCCIECNRIKNDKPLIDFLNRNRDRIRDDLIAAHPILSSLVTLCNATGRYEVTQSSTSISNSVSNSSSSSQEKNSRKKEKPVKQPATKHYHGTQNNVLLSDKEIFELKREYPDTYQAIIDNYSEIKAMKGYVYKSDYLAIKRWGADSYFENLDKKKPKAGITQPRHQVIHVEHKAPLKRTPEEEADSQAKIAELEKEILF